MSFKNYISLVFIFSGIVSFAQPKVKLDTFSRTFSAPIGVENDGYTSRVFIVQQNGIIWTMDSNGVKLDTFIDLRAKVQNSGEEGLLGMAFHPDYKNNGYFYTYYTKKSTTDNAVFRYKVSSNPNRANIDSQLLVINFSHPIFTNHNGGCIRFGKDGYLYIGTGDGGSGGDPNNNAQNKNSLLGKLHRLNVNNFSVAYTVPANNPFVGQTNVKTEIWAYGLRNPWRYSFDRETGDLWLADVGQNTVEETNFQSVSNTGGDNYGWRCYEGNTTYNSSGCSGASNYKFPFFTYGRNGTTGGYSVTGGFIYKGNKYNDLRGYYIFTDYVSGNFWLTKKTDTIFTTVQQTSPKQGNISSFGEDIRGELYATNLSNGVVYKIRELCSPFQISLFNKKNPSCPNVANGSIAFTSVGSNGSVSYSWSNGNNGSTISNLAPDKYVVTATDGIGCVRKDSVVLFNQDTLRTSLTKQNPSCPNVTNGQITAQAFDGFGPITYNWSNGGNTATINNLAPNKYIVTITDSVGCSAKDSVVLTNKDTLRTSLTKQNPSCPNVTNGQINAQAFDGFGPITYNWSNGGNTATINNLAPNKYVVTVTDSVGCSAKDSVVLFNADTLDKPIIIKSNDTLFTANGFIYKWYKDGILISDANQSFYKILLNGSYKVEITDINGCKAMSDSLSVIITSVKNKNTDLEKFSLYPNPANDNLMIDIRFNSNKKSTLKIINSIGQIVYSEILQGKDILRNISLQQLSKGLYQLSIFTEDGLVSTQTFVKE